MREAIEQEKIVQFCEWKHIPMFAVPNGGRRDPREAKNLKRQGVKAGVPDMMFPVAKHGYHGLFIELKVGNNKPTAAQKRWLELLKMNGYCAEVCYGSDDAIELIRSYMEEDKL